MGPSRDLLPHRTPARSSASNTSTAWARLPVPYPATSHSSPPFLISIPISPPTHPKPHAVPSSLLPAHNTGMLNA